MTLSGPINELNVVKPSKRLLSFEIIISVLGQTFIQLIFQLLIV